MMVLHGELFGELGNFLEISWYSSYLEDYNAMMLETSERHRGDKQARMCWKYREVWIRKDGELLESPWRAFWRAPAVVHIYTMKSNLYFEYPDFMKPKVFHQTPIRLPADYQKTPSRLPADSQQIASRLPVDSWQTSSRLLKDSQKTPSRFPTESIELMGSFLRALQIWLPDRLLTHF